MSDSLKIKESCCQTSLKVEWLTERRLYVWQEDMPDSMAANHICAEDILENRLDKQSLKKILKESRISGNRIHILNQMIKTSDR